MTGVLLLTWLCAQTPMGVATQVQSDGFRVSETGRFHVGGNVDLRFDSNPAFYPQDAKPDLALRLRVIAGYVQPSDKLDLQANLSADWTQYMGIVYAGTRTLSAFQAALNLALIANKDGFMTFFFTEQASRVEQPANDAISQRLKSIRSYTRLGTDIRPGGRALEIRAQYGLDFVLFDENQQSVLDPRALTSMTHSPSVRGLWRFFPKTALTLDLDGAFTRYPFASTSFTNPPLNALRVQAGVIGLITEKLTVTVRAGYANTFVMQPPGAATPARNFSNVIGLAQLNWRPFQTTTLSLGYQRDFAPTSVYGWVSYDRAFLEAQQLFLGRFAAQARAVFEYQNFGTPVLAGLTARQDQVIRGEVRFIYQALSWIAGSVFYMPDFRISNFISPIGVSGQYSRHVAGLDVTLAY